MHRSFIRLVVAASLAITGIGVAAGPVRADNDDTARALAAILGIAIVGAAIHNSNKDKGHVTRHKPQITYHNHSIKRHKHHKQHQHVQRNDRYYEDVRPRHQSRNQLLPGHCLRSWKTRDGRMRVFGKRCLENNYRHTASLPDRCFRRARTHEGVRKGYAARCLSRHGYQLAHR